MFEDNENSQLQDLININKDACEFYESAQNDVRDPQLKQTMRNLETVHDSVVVNIGDYMRAKGAESEPNETFTGKANQFWGELKAKMSNDVDETLVTQLEEAEDRCLHSMQDAMKDPDIHPETKALLSRELGTLKKSHDYMKAIKDHMQRAA